MDNLTPMKLLVLINGWSGNAISGGDYHILRVLKEWGESHNISIIMPFIGLVACKPLLSQNYKIYLSSKNKDVIYSFKTIPAYIGRIIRAAFVKPDETPDAVVCSSHLLYDTIPGIILRSRFKSQLVVYIHHIIGENAEHRSGFLSRISILNEKMSLYIIRHANILFVVNEQVREHLLKIGFGPKKIHLSGNGLDYDAIESVGKEQQIRFDACFCGRLVKSKGVYDLLPIWKYVMGDFPNAKLLVIGDGPEYANLLRKIKDSKLEDNIQMTGFITETQKLSAMHESKVYVSPSYEEGWGIAVTEAIACGIPVVIYDLGAYKAFEGYFIKVQKGNARKMADAVIQVLNNSTNKVSNKKPLRLNSIPDWNFIAKREIEEIQKASPK